MKALLYIAPKKIVFKDIPRPQIKPHEVLLKVKTVGICGTDLHIYNGGMNLPTPLIIGHEFSGIIEKVGADVQKFKKGERVVAEHVITCGRCAYCQQGKPNLCANAKIIGVHLPGALAEYLAIPSDLVYKIPDNLTLEEAALIEPLSIAYYAAKEVGFVLDKKVAVVGQGPIGLLVDQILKAAGARVIGLDIQEARLAFARKMKWIDVAINTTKQNLLAVLNPVAPEGTDITFEVVGQESTAELALEITRRNGTVILLGVFESPSKINLMHLVKKELNVKGSWTCAFSFPESIELAAQRKVDLKSLITHRYPFKNALMAFEEAFSYTNKRIKTIINF